MRANCGRRWRMAEAWWGLGDGVRAGLRPAQTGSGVWTIPDRWKCIRGRIHFNKACHPLCGLGKEPFARKTCDTGGSARERMRTLEPQDAGMKGSPGRETAGCSLGKENMGARRRCPSCAWDSADGVSGDGRQGRRRTRLVTGPASEKKLAEDAVREPHKGG